MSAVLQTGKEEKVAQWCKQYIAAILGIDPTAISDDDDFDSYGLDSALMTSMIIDMEEEFKADVPPSVLFSQSTIHGIATEVAKLIA